VSVISYVTFAQIVRKRLNIKHKYKKQLENKRRNG
jgi:hypothetical protein